MTTQISLDNIQQATLNTIGSGPRITSVVVTDSSYNNLDDTAVDTAGGFIKILGAGFKTGCTVTVNRQQATSVVFVSATEIRAQIPAETAGTYVVYVVNTDGSVALRVNGVTFSALPAWTTGSTLPNGDSGTAVSIQLAAAQATQYTLAQGSTLPPGLTLSSSGLLSGTVTVASETLYNFQIVATDAQLQDSPRTFSITISVGDPLFAQTTLLLPGSANTYVRDASTNNLAITPAGDARPNTFNPYLTGWSNLFDGNGDTLSIASSSAFNISGNFTIEGWYNFTALPPANQNDNLWNFSGASTNNPYLYLWGDGTIILRTAQTSGTVFTATHNFALNTWYHIAVVKSGTTFTLYINGTSTATGTSSAIVSENKSLVIGESATFGLQGYLSNFRIVNGTALYTANFTPPTQPLTAVAGTVLLTCQSNRFVDNSSNNFTITRGGDVAVRSFNPFQEPATTNGSGFFDGTGDFLTVPTSSFFPAVNTYTIEMWAYPTSWPGSNSIALYHVTNSLIDFFGALVLVLTGSGTIRFDVRPSNGGTNVSITATSTIALNSWNHIAVSVNSGSVTLYINGVASGTGTVQVLNGTQAHCAIGYMTNGFTSGQSSFAGYISNVRVIRNTALYTANFTPPTSPLTAVANTSLLTLQTNQPHNNSQFLDSSSENHLITRNGNTTQGTFSPYSPSGWSNYFDGTGDGFSLSSAGVGPTGTEDFTFEMWAYITQMGGSFPRLFEGTNNGNFQVYLASGELTVGGNGTGTVLSHNIASLANQWIHICITRSSTALRIFINGTLRAFTNSGGTNFTSSSSWRSVNEGSGIVGYISNLRIVRGSVVSSYATSSTTTGTSIFTPPTQPLTVVPGTSLLTCCDNRLIDDSVNNFAITRTGDVRVSNFSPFRAQTQVPNTYSAFFDNSGDYLSLATNAAFGYGTDAFTIECWFNAQSITASGGDYLFDQRTATSQAALLALINTSGQLEIYVNAVLVISGGTVALNTWNHFALSRSGTTTRMFLNGVQVGSSYTDNNNYLSTTPMVIGSRFSAEDFFHGYISNFRVIKGTALYTANFTPPTSPLTAVANTSLLTCQSPTFTDNSSNRFAITAFGNSQPTMVNPFGSTFTSSTGYSAADHGGSMYFDGTGDNLVLPLNPIFAIGTVDITVEAWVYPTSANQPWSVIFAGAAFGSSSDWGLYLGTGTTALFPKFQFTNTVGQEVVSSVAVRQGEWSHIAVTRTAGTARIFINGVQTGTANAASWSLTNVHQKALGATAAVNGSTTLTGYISNLRVIAGRSLYSSNFAPPVAPVQPVQGTVLLLNGTSAGIADATTKNVIETLGDARVVTAVSRTGGSSMQFDGSGDYLTIPNSPIHATYVGNFTVECWFYLNSVTGTQTIVSHRNASSGTGAFVPFIFWTEANVLRLYASSNGSSWNVVNATALATVAAGQWYHLAYTRSGSTCTVFLNGTSVTSFTSSAIFTTTNPLQVGMTGPGETNSALNGYVQDLRITQGTARYTANFTPPAGAFQTR